jgi:hypothetical protein
MADSGDEGYDAASDDGARGARGAAPRRGAGAGSNIPWNKRECRECAQVYDLDKAWTRGAAAWRGFFCCQTCKAAYAVENDGEELEPDMRATRVTLTSSKAVAERQDEEVRPRVVAPGFPRCQPLLHCAWRR